MNAPQIIVTILLFVISSAAAVFSVLLRFSFVTYEKNHEKRFSDLEKDALVVETRLNQDVKDLMTKKIQLNVELTARIHALEIRCSELAGDAKLLKSNHDRSTNDIETIKDKMVTRDEWESRMKGLEDLVRSVLSELRRPGSARYEPGKG